MNLEFPPVNRNARAQYAGALLTREQSREAVANLEQLVESDVRTAYSEVLRAGEQVTATAASRKLQEAKLKSETEKFRVGQSTTFLVAQAQRDLLSSQIDEVDAVVTYRKGARRNVSSRRLAPPAPRHHRPRRNRARRSVCHGPLTRDRQRPTTPRRSLLRNLLQ